MNTIPTMPVTQPYEAYLLIPKTTFTDMQAERDRWAEAASEQMTQTKRLGAEVVHLGNEVERLKAQVKSRDGVINGLKVAVNKVLDF